MPKPQNAPTVEKAKIVVVDESGNETGDSLVCMYNPEVLQYKRSPSFEKKNIPGQELAEDHRSGGGEASLTVKLLFDTTQAMTVATDGVDVTQGADVRTYVKFLFGLLKEGVDDAEGNQPYCRFIWGGKIYIVKGFLSSLDATYNLFLPDGTPVRADVSITIEEQASLEQLDQLWQNPTSRSAARKTWVIREGDRLDYIAYREYKNPACWRHIAETNGIDDPFNLRPGRILKLVPLP